MRGIRFAGFDHIRIGNRRKRHIAGIFDRRRRWIGNRNFGWWKWRQVARGNARLGRGRLGNLLRMAGITRVLSLRAHGSAVAWRMMNPANALLPSRFRKRPAARNRES